MECLRDSGMEMIMRKILRKRITIPRPVRVQRDRVGDGVPPRGEGGFTLIEVVMTMMLLSLGIMSLGPLMLSVVRGNRFAQNLSLATSLAEDRMEEILHHNIFSEITTANFPTEAQGQVEQGDQAYTRYARVVAIADSIDAGGRTVLKAVSVTVTWMGLSQTTHDVNLHGRVARF